jgi:hypothetical protein
VIILYGGRLTLERRSLIENWHALLRFPALDERIDLKTKSLNEAFFLGSCHYQAVRKSQPFDQVVKEHRSSPQCWRCVQWSPIDNGCSLGWPEARASGGRYARKCDLWNDGTASAGTFDAAEKLLY